MFKKVCNKSASCVVCRLAKLASIGEQRLCRANNLSLMEKSEFNLIFGSPGYIVFAFTWS